jgi:hypothetical protein
MRDSLITYALGLASLLLAGPVAWLLTSSIVDASGGHGTTLLHASGVGASLTRGAGAIVIAGVMGVLTARLVGLRAAFWNCGMVLAWAAAGLGTIDQVLRAREGSQSLLTTLALEAGVVMVLVAGIAVACWKFAREAPARSEGWTDLTFAGRASAVALGAAASAAAAGLVAHFAMINNLKGQAIGAAGMGAAAASVAVALLAPRAPAFAVVTGAMLAGVLGPVVAQFMTPPSQVSPAVFAWGLLGPARITAMDWAAGAMLGAPMGLWIAGGLLERRHAAEARTA